MSDDHFGANPDAVLWTATEELNRSNTLLRQITDACFRRGEYAE